MAAVTSLTTFWHCFPRDRQTGLIASTSDPFQLKRRVTSCSSGAATPGFAPRLRVATRFLPAQACIKFIPSRRRALLQDRRRLQSSRLINPTIISRNRGHVNPSVTCSTYLFSDHVVDSSAKSHTACFNKHLLIGCFTRIERSF